MTEFIIWVAVQNADGNWRCGFLDGGNFIEENIYFAKRFEFSQIKNIKAISGDAFNDSEIIKEFKVLQIMS